MPQRRIYSSARFRFGRRERGFAEVSRKNRDGASDSDEGNAILRKLFRNKQTARASGSEEDGRAGGVGQQRRASKAVAMARQLSVRMVSMPLSGISVGSFDQNRLMPVSWAIKLPARPV